MDIYLVGGAVRDRLLGLPVRERDWVVVGATPEAMAALGYRRVGRDFPVFLHPETHEEYALARTERKHAPGHRGFTVHAGPAVTLQDDLRRRDLTINAMAESSDGDLIDPYGGRRDLERRLLRHVSPAFAEDPLRVLRAARLVAQLAGFGFEVAAETRALMRAMAHSGELQALSSERVWGEIVRALQSPAPRRFIEVLRDCDALKAILPEVDALFGVPQPERWHPEIDTGVHVLMALDQSVRLSTDPVVRFAVLMHDLGKAVTPRERWPGHRGHERRSARLVEVVCPRLRVPRAYRSLALAVAREHTRCHRALELCPGTLLNLLDALDVWRRPSRLEPFLLACEADARGRLGLEQRAYPQAQRLRTAYQAARAVRAVELARQGLAGVELGAALRRRRLQAIAAVVPRRGHRVNRTSGEADADRREGNE